MATFPPSYLNHTRKAEISCYHQDEVVSGYHEESKMTHIGYGIPVLPKIPKIPLYLTPQFTWVPLYLVLMVWVLIHALSIIPHPNTIITQET